MGTEKVLVHSKPYCLWLKHGKKVPDRMGSGGVVLMDLLKVFDTINYDLLLAKLHACGCTNESLLFRSQTIFQHLLKWFVLFNWMY